MCQYWNNWIGITGLKISGLKRFGYQIKFFLPKKNELALVGLN